MPSWPGEAAQAKPSDLIAVRVGSVSTDSPHPEEHRGAVRLEGPTPSRRALRALLRVRWCGFTVSESALATGMRSFASLRMTEDGESAAAADNHALSRSRAILT